MSDKNPRMLEQTIAPDAITRMMTALFTSCVNLLFGCYSTFGSRAFPPHPPKHRCTQFSHLRGMARLKNG